MMSFLVSLIGMGPDMARAAPAKNPPSEQSVVHVLHEFACGDFPKRGCRAEPQTQSWSSARAEIDKSESKFAASQTARYCFRTRFLIRRVAD
jgi:hypothetical protein